MHFLIISDFWHKFIIPPEYERILFTFEVKPSQTTILGRMVVLQELSLIIHEKHEGMEFCRLAACLFNLFPIKFIN